MGEAVQSGYDSAFNQRAVIKEIGYQIASATEIAEGSLCYLNNLMA